MTVDKKTLRRSILAERERLDTGLRARLSAEISVRVIRELESLACMNRHGAGVFLFMPFGHEADITPVARWCWKEGIPVIAPLTIREPRRLQLHLVNGPEALEPGTWGIPEPKADTPPADPAGIGAVLVPGVAFDPQGGRLGYGGGYYDRFFEELAARGLNPPKIAPAFGMQVVDRVPTEAHDVRMDVIVTESRRLAAAGRTEEEAGNGGAGG